MRRALDWLVLSIALLLLSASHIPSGPAEPVSTPMAAEVSAQETLFAYIREDGSEVRLTGEVVRRQEIPAANAVYTWSAHLPAGASLTPAPPLDFTLISASPSSR